MSGKMKLYPKVKESFVAAGYSFYDGDTDIKGKTRQHRRKPDYIAVRDDLIIIGEIKSAKEPPTSGIWRRQKPNDSAEFAKVRQDILDLESAGMLDPNIGGHGIIIRGQIPDYVANIGITYELPASREGAEIRGGYTVPSEQTRNVKIALSNCGKIKYRILGNGNGPATFIFEL
jgi:hypothetical protein